MYIDVSINFFVVHSHLSDSDKSAVVLSLKVICHILLNFF